MGYWNNVKFDEIKWTSLVYSVATGFDAAYVKALKELRYDSLKLPELVKDNEVDIGYVVLTFLIKWHTRPLSNKKESPVRGLLTQQISKIAKDLEELRKKRTSEVDPESVKKCYKELLEIKHGFSHVAAAKTLHILCPETLVAWDNTIMEKFAKEFENEAPSKLKTRDDYAELYVLFLKKMSQITEQFSMKEVNDLNDALKPLHEKNNFCPKSKAKLIDEFNWIKIRKGMKFPKEWPPK